LVWLIPKTILAVLLRRLQTITQGGSLIGGS